MFTLKLPAKVRVTVEGRTFEVDAKLDLVAVLDSLIRRRPIRVNLRSVKDKATPEVK